MQQPEQIDLDLHFMDDKVLLGMLSIFDLYRLRNFIDEWIKYKEAGGVTSYQTMYEIISEEEKS